MKQMVRRCLESLGLNPSEHHIKDYNVKTVKARRQQNKNRHFRDFRGSIRQPEPARSQGLMCFMKQSSNNTTFMLILSMRSLS